MKKQIFKGQIISLNLETFSLDEKSPQTTFEIVRHPGGAGVVVIDKNEHICLLKQYRYAIEKWIWEIPAGKLEDNEKPEMTIQRELIEEAGIIAQKWTSLGHIVTSPGILDEYLHLFLAQDLSNTQAQLEEHEYIEVHWFSIKKVTEMALNGEIIDAKTIIAIWRANDYLNQRDKKIAG